MSKLILFVLALIVFYLLFACSKQQSEAFNIAIDITPYKNINGQCVPFANDLSNRLLSKGYKNAVVWFHYRNSDGVTGSHACVIYNDPTYPKYWLMDNIMSKPIWLPKTLVSVYEQIAFAYPGATYIQIYQLTEKTLTK